MSIPPKRRRVAIVLAWALVVVSSDVVRAAPANLRTASGTELQYSDAATTPLVTYSEIAGAAGAGPTLTIYGDGGVVAEYPPGWKRAGRHRLQLRRAELDVLVGTIVDAGVVDFDAAGVTAAVRAAESAQRAASVEPQLSVVSDPDVTVVTVNLDRYQRVGGPATAAISKRVAWNSLTRDVRQHPTIGALTGLEAARQALRAVLVRGDYTRED